jgi:hypothetical protein
LICLFYLKNNLKCFFNISECPIVVAPNCNFTPPEAKVGGSQVRGSSVLGLPIHTKEGSFQGEKAARQYIWAKMLKGHKMLTD